MRISAVGAAIACVLLVTALVAGTLPASGVADRGTACVAGGGLITHVTRVEHDQPGQGSSYQQLVVVHPELQTIGVYHVDLASGEVTLKSVRNIRWDLQMHEFNGTSPSPREIQSQLQNARH